MSSRKMCFDAWKECLSFLTPFDWIMFARLVQRNWYRMIREIWNEKIGTQKLVVMDHTFLVVDFLQQVKILYENDNKLDPFHLPCNASRMFIRGHFYYWNAQLVSRWVAHRPTCTHCTTRPIVEEGPVLLDDDEFVTVGEHIERTSRMDTWSYSIGFLPYNFRSRGLLPLLNSDYSDIHRDILLIGSKELCAQYVSDMNTYIRKIPQSMFTMHDKRIDYSMHSQFFECNGDRRVTHPECNTKLVIVHGVNDDDTKKDPYEFGPWIFSTLTCKEMAERRGFFESVRDFDRRNIHVQYPMIHRKKEDFVIFSKVSVSQSHILSKEDVEHLTCTDFGTFI